LSLFQPYLPPNEHDDTALPVSKADEDFSVASMMEDDWEAPILAF
jgi:hypothetical protein